jgi:hypothetical protein
VGLFANSSTFTNIIMLKIGVYRRASAVAIRRGKMDNADSQDNGRATLRSWAVVLGIALAFLLWGLLVYSSVGDKGPRAVSIFDTPYQTIADSDPLP